MNPRYIRLRSWARRSVLINLLSYYLKVQNWWHRRLYRIRKPSTFSATIAGCEVKMLVESELEYVSLMRKGEDIRLASCLLNRLRTGDTAWDIGANVGFYTVALAKTVGATGEVYAFEPESRSAARLQQNLELNGLTNVTIVPLALADKAGRLSLASASEASQGFHRLDLSGTAALGQPGMMVDVASGDDFRAEHAAGVPCTIKVDVEGAEEEVILGLRHTLSSSECRTFLGEIHFAILESRGRAEAPLRIEKLLREYGFVTLKWVDRSHLLACK